MGVILVPVSVIYNPLFIFLTGSQADRETAQEELRGPVP